MLDGSPAIAVMERHRNRVYSFCHYCLGSKEDAEDVAQEVLMRFWRNFETIDPGHYERWLMKVSANACKDVIRKRQTRRQVFDEGGHDLLGSRPDHQVTKWPGHQLAAREIRQSIEAALKTLNDTQRTIVVLREIQQKSYTEISEILDLPLTQVKVYLHRGRQAMRAVLARSREYGEI